MSQPPSPSRQRLATLLRRLRDEEELSTYQLAEVLGWSQSRVTRIERGLIVANAADVQAWADATNASRSVRDELSELAYEAWTQSRSWRTAHRRGLAARQREMAQLEKSCTGLRHFQPEAIPGLLQAPAYAREVIRMADVTDQGDIDDAVAARMARQKVLRQRGREFRFVLAEGALRWRPGPPEVMAAQRAHLLAAAEFSAVNVATIPYGQQARVPYIHPFMIFDLPEGPLVVTEQYAGETFSSDARDVAVYEQTFRALAASALTGDGMLEFIRSTMA
jgi:transcriptional regulator with XRE-family HTH domain